MTPSTVSSSLYCSVYPKQEERLRINHLSPYMLYMSWLYDCLRYSILFVICLLDNISGRGVLEMKTNPHTIVHNSGWVT
jgi:hypothetical protein